MAMTEWEICRAANGSKEIQIILCDDDPDFLKVLERQIARVFTKRNSQTKITAFSCPTEISQERLTECDIAFLDIDYACGDRNGIDTARMLRQVNDRALIFFVTNYIDYAPAGYEVQAFRYILKRDLEDVLERYILQAMEQSAEEQVCLRLKSRDEAVDIPLMQIFYLEVMDHSVSIHTGQGHYETNTTLSALEEKLGPHSFLRIHKSYLVNMAHIRKLRSRECLLADGTALAVGEKNYAQQKQKYLLWKGLK